MSDFEIYLNVQLATDPEFRRWWAEREQLLAHHPADHQAIQSFVENPYSLLPGPTVS